MNWQALVPIALKYLPVIIDFIQKEGPAVQSLIKDIEAAVQTATAGQKPPTGFTS